ncbi:MAG: RNA polymerase sigma-54 factor [Burkholderiaceae bacterium]|jgi:RNA polymerase sigma-54 factor|nr:RNA polymerase sigma-54 factor [Burkholderiaceae bacterium]
MKIALKTQFGQHLALTPQLQRSIQLLQISSAELEEEVAKAAEENPMLDYYPPDQSKDDGEPNEKMEMIQANWAASAPSRDDDEDWDTRHEQQAQVKSLLNYLEEQIQSLRIDPPVKGLVVYLAGCLDERGYLPESLEDLATEIHSELKITKASAVTQLKTALTELQKLDPAGIGAHSLAECLCLQIQRQMQFDTEHSDKLQLALNLAQNHLSKIAQKDWSKLRQIFKQSEANIMEAVAHIRTLQHNPGEHFDTNVEQWISPDVFIKLNAKGKWVVHSNQAIKPRLTLNQEYSRILKENNAKKNNLALHQKMLEARWLIKNIEQREETILKVAEAIVERQQNFFHQGNIAMKPLVLREIAAAIGMHESTISRVTNNKYLACPAGIFEFKYFFSAQLSSEKGQAVSATAVQSLIKQIILDETPKKPISDNQITNLLASQGFVVARRTVAKYRELLRIPPAHLRKN